MEYTQKPTSDEIIKTITYVLTGSDTADVKKRMSAKFDAVMDAIESNASMQRIVASFLKNGKLYEKQSKRFREFLILQSSDTGTAAVPQKNGDIESYGSTNLAMIGKEVRTLYQTVWYTGDMKPILELSTAFIDKLLECYRDITGNPEKGGAQWWVKVKVKQRGDKSWWNDVDDDDYDDDEDKVKVRDEDARTAHLLLKMIWTYLESIHTRAVGDKVEEVVQKEGTQPRWKSIFGAVQEFKKLTKEDGILASIDMQFGDFCTLFDDIILGMGAYAIIIDSKS